MAQQEQTAKKPKRHTGLIIFLLILLLLAGGAGYLYYSVVKDPMTVDDPQKLANSPTMSVQDRFRFSSADQTAQIKLDKGDIWYLVLSQAGPDFMDSINAELARFELNLSGCAISLEEGALTLDLELYFRDIRLVAKVPCDLSCSGNLISLKPTGVKLGAISLPVNKFLESAEFGYALNLPVITEVNQVSIVKDGILIKGVMGQDFADLVPQDEKLNQTALYCDFLQPIADALLSEDGFDTILSYLEKNPGAVEDLYRDLFLMAGKARTQEYLDNRLGLTQRFLPGIDYPSLEPEQFQLKELLNSYNQSLELYFTSVVNDYNEKKFRLSGGEFLLNRKPFEAAKYGKGKYNNLFELLDPESIFLILVDAEDGFIRKTSSFYRMCDDKQEFTQPVDFNKTYILGMVVRSVDGDPFLMYEMEVDMENTYARNIKLCSLSEDDVAALQVPGKFGVWIG